MKISKLFAKPYTVPTVEYTLSCLSYYPKNHHMEDINLLKQEVLGEVQGLVVGKGRGGRRVLLQENSSIREQERAPEW